RPNYTLEGSQTWYLNEDSGVYFGFEIQEPDGEDFEPLAFTMNYFRPSYFILEAEPEVARFVAALDLLVASSGEYDRERMIAGWLRGNEFGYRVYANNDDTREGILTLPTATLTTVWRWNFLRQTLQAALGEDTFVPLIMLLTIDGTLHTA